MTEADWLACENPAAMIIFLGKRLSQRKQELFFCGVRRLFWEYFSDDCYRRYCEVKERFMDGQATKEEMDAANEATSGDRTALIPAFDELTDVGKREASILRHISGNPFKPYPTAVSCPLAVVKLAEAAYHGKDSFALYDALLEVGHRDIAEHFKDEKWHPKGCWALDLILGRE